MSTNNPDRLAEKEIADVVVILNVSTSAQARDAVAGLQAAGLNVVRFDEDNGMVEGTLDPGKLAALRRLPAVKHARLRFEYIAEAPATNPRNGAS